MIDEVRGHLAEFADLVDLFRPGAYEHDAAARRLRTILRTALRPKSTPRRRGGFQSRSPAGCGRDE
jgi:hypothetical protein